MTELAYAAAVETLRKLIASMRGSDVWAHVVTPQKEVLDRFQPFFHPEHVPDLTAEEFEPFLYIEHNRHWTGLYRQVNRLCADMPALRRVLATLLDEGEPVEQRLDEIAGSIKGLGKGTITAILLVAHPGKYGVWNGTSERALTDLEIFPDFERGTSFGTQYARINQLFCRLAGALKIDLWTLDALWWMLLQGNALPTGSELNTVAVAATPLAGPNPPNSAAAAFGLERHLHDFLVDNWDRLDIGKEWSIYATPENAQAGYEYACGVGRIDILAKHRSLKKWLIVELKRGETSDIVVAQALRYMGWVRQRLAQPGDEVQGLIIAREGDDALQFAIGEVPSLQFQVYEVEFRLKRPPSIGA